MSVSRRIGAFLCALALILHFTFVPLRVCAFAGVLPAVGAGVVVTSFLMASGIYPYAEQEEFAQYVSDNLSSLWSQYLDWRTAQALDPPPTGDDLSSLTGYLAQGVVAISRGVWNTLSEFASWIVNHFALADNQTGVQLGTVAIGAYAWLPVVSDYSQSPYPVARMLSVGYNAPDRDYWVCATDGVNTQIKIVYYKEGNYYYLALASARPMGGGAAGIGFVSHFYNNALGDNDTWRTGFNGSVISQSYHGFYYGFAATSLAQVLPEYCNPDVAVYDTQQQVLEAFDDGVWSPGVDTSGLAGVTADTTIVSPPAALPADTPWAGLAVGGTGTAATVGAVEQVIQEGVIQRQKPEVKVVEVELGANTDVDIDTGEVTESPVVVTPESVVPSISALVDGTLVTAIGEAMQNKFPFSMFFDLTKLLNAFKKYPQAPVISLSFHDNFSGGDYTITVDLAPWDEVALIVRQLETMILLLGFWLNFDKFNVLNIILGQLG